MEQVIEFLKGELTRVQNERDTAQANERKLWNVIAELKEQVGTLSTLASMAQENGCSADEYEDAIDKVDSSRQTIVTLMNTWAVNK